MITRTAIVDEARAWIGTRWLHQAALKGVGCDCIGLVAGVARELGITGAERFFATPALRAYGRAPEPRLIDACEMLLDPIRTTDAGPGDVLVLRFETEPQHFALMSSSVPPYMIHALAMARRVAEHRIDAIWASRIVRAFRFRGVNF